MRDPRHLLSLALTLLALGAAPVDAQRLAPGTHVRITDADSRQWSGRVVADTGTLLVRRDGDTIVVPVTPSSASLLEVSAGTVRRQGRAVAIGLGGGAISGWLIAYNRLGRPTCGNHGYCLPRPGELRGAAIGGAVGAALGAIVGMVGRERWTPREF